MILCMKKLLIVINNDTFSSYNSYWNNQIQYKVTKYKTYFTSRVNRDMFDNINENVC